MDKQELLTKIFKEILAQNGMLLREQQLKLSLEMFEAFETGKIALCEAEVGTGKTHAYILASVVHNLYAKHRKPCVISTSTIALQKAIVEDYLPQISKILFNNGVIKSPLSYIVRKGKSHYICENKLERYINSHDAQKGIVDIKHDKNIISFDNVSLKNNIKQKLCVSNCDIECKYKNTCRYKILLNTSLKKIYDFVIVNHNYFFTNIIYNKTTDKKLLPQYGRIIFDEAHKLPNTINDIYGQELGHSEIVNIFKRLCDIKNIPIENFGEIIELNKLIFKLAKEQKSEIIVMRQTIRKKLDKLLKQLVRQNVLLERLSQKNKSLHRVKWSLEKVIEKVKLLSMPDSNIIWITKDREMTIHFLSKKVKSDINKDLWDMNLPAVLTSGTISVDGDFSHLEENLGLNKQRRLIRMNTISPFNYMEQGLVYLAKYMPYPNTESEDYQNKITDEVVKIINATHGHSLILFTSYKLMDNIYHKVVKKKTPFPVHLMKRSDSTALENFKNSENSVLFATDSAGEGIDIAGDTLSSVIIVRLPFPNPSPLTEYQKIHINNFELFLEKEIVPKMIIKLRQWMGRGIRRETDTCVFSILDPRVNVKIRNQIFNALPQMLITTDIADVEHFIKTKKSDDYFK